MKLRPIEIELDRFVQRSDMDYIQKSCNSDIKRKLNQNRDFEFSMHSTLLRKVLFTQSISELRELWYIPLDSKKAGRTDNTFLKVKRKGLRPLKTLF